MSRASGAGAAAGRVAVRVRLFAGFREVVGVGELVRDVPEGTTLRQLWDALADEHARLAQWPPSGAVNGAWSRPEAVLADGDEVAFLPPVAGG